MKPFLKNGSLVLFLLVITIPVFAQAPAITYSPSTNNLSIGVPFSISPVNTGGAVPTTTYSQVTTFAGSTAGTAGYTNATGTAARFNDPYAAVSDASGNLYVAENGNNSIRKITAAGVVTTFAGSTSGTSGFTNATGTAARFNGPQGIAIDASGNLFVADFNNNAIRKITAAGVVTTFYSSAGLSPTGMGFDASGNLLVATQGLLSQIMSITTAGVRTTIAGNHFGYVNGTGTAALFADPEDVQADVSGNIFVADYLNNAIRKIASGAVVTTFAGSNVNGNTGGFADGNGTAAKFNNLTGIAIAGGGIIYVADLLNNDIRRVMPNGDVTLIAGSATQASGTTDGTGTAAKFNTPVDLFIDGTGTGYVLGGNAVRKIVLTGYTINGTLPAGLSFDPATGIISGTPTTTTASHTYTITAYNAGGFSSTTITLSAAPLLPPSIAYVPSTGSLHVGVPFSTTPVNSGGAVPATTYSQVTTFAGSTAGTAGYTNATGTAARFNDPYAIVSDASGNLYVAENGNNAIRKITPAGVVTTFAGSTTGASGFTNATGTAARFNGPQGIAIDASGNLFVSDFNNNAIRKITPAGVVTTFYSFAGLSPTGLCFDASGNLLVATQGLLSQIMSITPAGVRTTLAGNNFGYVNGTGSAALFADPEDVQADASGNIFVADYLNNALRRIAPGNVVTTFAGSTVNGNTGAFADGVGTAARFNNLTGVALGSGNVIYVADLVNNNIRRVMPDGTVTLIAGSATQVAGSTDGTGTAARFDFPVDLFVDASGTGYVAGGNSIRKIILTGYTLTGTLPAGLSFDPATGIISGTPTTITAATTLVVTAYNGSGYSSTSIDIIVSGPAAKQYDWTGAVSSVWANGANWGSGAVPGATDTVRIGLTHFTNQPTVGANVQAGRILLGGEVPVTLTVNTGVTLQVNGPVIQYHGPGLIAPASTLAGSGAITCTSMAIGNNLLSKIVKNKTTVFTSKIASLTVSDSLVVSSCTIDLLSGGLAHNNATFSLEGGLVAVGGKIRLDNFIPPYIDSLPVSKPLTKFVITINSSANATLSLADSNAFRLVHSGLDSVDLYNPVAGTGKSTVIYSGGDQLVFTNNKAGLDTTPYTYQNLSVSGSGIKTAGKDTTNNLLNVGGALNITGGTLNLETFAPQTVVRGNFSNTGAITFGTKTTTFTGASFFNAGGFTVGTGVIKFSGGTQALRDSTLSGTNFRKLSINHTGIKSIQSGKFAIVSDGKIRMSDAATLNVAAGATLTLRADSTGTAAIAALLAGCSVTGTVNVEQYIQGSIYLNNSSARGYKLFSSAVYTATDTSSSAHVYDVRYLTNSLTAGLTDILLISGFNGTTNGFNVNTPTNNPTIYLFREDDPPPPTNTTPFLTQYNWKGIAQINNTPVYSLGIQKFGTRTNIADTATTIPVGNGMLVFFRGNAVLSNGTTAGSKLLDPVNYPEDVTLTQAGRINSDVIRLRLWFANAGNGLGNKFSFTPANNLHSTAKLRAGAVCAGNPYPAPINWDNLSTTDTASSIYGPNLMAVIYELNPANGQYESYTADASHDRNQVYHGSGAATNIISSTRGFFAFVDTLSATPHDASLTFREEAKFDPDAGSSPGEFSLLLKRPLLKTVTLSKDAAKKSVKETLTGVPSDPDRGMENPSGSVIPAGGKNSIKGVVQPGDEKMLSLKLIPLKDPVKTDDILIKFTDNATLAYSRSEDAVDAGGTPEAMSMLSSYSSEGVKLAINCSPLPERSEVIKLYTNATLTGEYRLNASLIQKIPASYSLVLKDNRTGRLTDLRKNAGYTFKIDKADESSYGDRFELIIEKSDTQN